MQMHTTPPHLRQCARPGAESAHPRLTRRACGSGATPFGSPWSLGEGEPGWRRHHALGFLAGERPRELRNTWLGRDLAERPSTSGTRGGGTRPSCWYLPPRKPRRGTHSTRSRRGVCPIPLGVYERADTRIGH
ncbi:hypothetical protein NDU88_009384 [Pleurodeles waltl]|uniref:Uncharacterized protein n=1 Tax=Pleurodeles waltl TaxID=8319 RepID=A0AAV7QUF4_PLEWA|nr:hypothetical protein NDU88_009384 [Pleurodeles waltl]